MYLPQVGRASWHQERFQKGSFVLQRSPVHPFHVEATATTLQHKKETETDSADEKVDFKCLTEREDRASMIIFITLKELQV